MFLLRNVIIVCPKPQTELVSFVCVQIFNKLQSNKNIIGPELSIANIKSRVYSGQPVFAITVPEYDSDVGF
jgi:hypothetical protein